MILIALTLGCLGVFDLVRWNVDASGRRAVLALGAVAGGAALVLALGGSSLLSTLRWTGLLTALALVWWLASASSVERERTWPGLAAITGITAGVVALSSYGPELGGRLERWHSSLPVENLAGPPFERFLAVMGASLFLLNSANVVVRLVLAAAGTRVEGSEQQLKGGRILGPMERLLIFGLGLSGELAAAAIIVAAKGLLRFPELQAHRAEPGRRVEGNDSIDAQPQRIDVLTEYFLIGSMSSWLIALATLVLV